MLEFGNEQEELQSKIESRLANVEPERSSNLLLFKAAIAIADDKLDLAREALSQLKVLSLSDDQLGLAAILQARIHYSLGQIDELNAPLTHATEKLSQTRDPVLKFWLAADQLLISAYTKDDKVFERAAEYALSHLDVIPENLLGQSMLNVVAIGLTTGGRYNQAIDIENIKVERDEALGNIKGLSDSYYNLGGLYRNLLQPELALLNFMQCLDYSEQLGSELDQAFALQQMGAVAFELEDYENAEVWARKAYTLAYSTKTQQLYIPTSVTLAKVIVSSLPDESRKLIQEARNLSDEYNVEHFIKEIEIVERELGKQAN
jgi:tetratricopeptide (TPR) repeat protein